MQEELGRGKRARSARKYDDDQDVTEVGKRVWQGHEHAVLVSSRSVPEGACHGRTLVVKACPEQLQWQRPKGSKRAVVLECHMNDEDMARAQIEDACALAHSRVALEFGHRRPDTVLFVCNAGVNRSTLLCAHHLVQCGCDGKSAIAALEHGRGSSLPGWPVLVNPSFRGYIESLV